MKGSQPRRGGAWLSQPRYQPVLGLCNTYQPVRGGSWLYPPHVTRVSYRVRVEPWSHYNDDGVRYALTVWSTPGGFNDHL